MEGEAGRGPSAGSRLARALLLATAAPGCATRERAGPRVPLRYVGSSAIANFLRDAEPVHGGVRFVMDAAREGEGGERAIFAGNADLAGLARDPPAAIRERGIESARIGRDAIAVIVHAENPVRDLSHDALRAIFACRAKNWAELGGPNASIRRFVGTGESATLGALETAVHGEGAFDESEEVRRDAGVVERVAAEPGGIGLVSRAFLEGERGVRAVSVDGEEPDPANLDYPLARPFYLLWLEQNRSAAAFVEWTLSEEGQRVWMRRFAGARVVGWVRPSPRLSKTGILVVRTETFLHREGDTFYYPHHPYVIYRLDGALVRRVRNRFGDADERPTRVALEPGSYRIRARREWRGPVEFLVTIEAGRTTEARVEDLLRKAAREFRPKEG